MLPAMKPRYVVDMIRLYIDFWYNKNNPQHYACILTDHGDCVDVQVPPVAKRSRLTEHFQRAEIPAPVYHVASREKRVASSFSLTSAAELLMSFARSEPVLVMGEKVEPALMTLAMEAVAMEDSSSSSVEAERPRRKVRGPARFLD